MNSDKDSAPSERPDSPRSGSPRNGPRSPYGGLCAACLHARTIASDKGSVFVLCERAKNEPRFSRYPPQPVVACQGFER